MKKSIAFMISVVLTTTPYAGAETLPNGFSITTIPVSPSIKTARFEFISPGRGVVGVYAMPGTMICNSNGPNCALYTGKEAENIVQFNIPFQSSTGRQLTGTCSPTADDSFWTEITVGDTSTSRSYTIRKGETSAYDIPDGWAAVRVKSMKAMGMVYLRFSNQELCRFSFRDDSGGGGDFLRVRLASDLSHNGAELGIGVNPTVINTNARPDFAASTNLFGLGYPGVIEITTNKPVKIDLGAGESSSGTSFATYLRADSNALMQFNGKMTIYGTVTQPGVTSYTVNVNYVVS